MHLQANHWLSIWAATSSSELNIGNHKIQKLHESSDMKSSPYIVMDMNFDSSHDIQ
jgi:hypothetical protein